MFQAHVVGQGMSGDDVLSPFRAESQKGPPHAILLAPSVDVCKLSARVVFTLFLALPYPGIVCGKYARSRRKLALAGQAKICTPPGGAMVAKICKL